MTTNDNNWFIQHCAQVLMDNGYAAIHKDRLVNVGQQTAVPQSRIASIPEEFQAAFYDHVYRKAAAEFGVYMMQQGLLARAPCFSTFDEDLSAYVYRWGACVVLPRKTDASTDV